MPRSTILLTFVACLLAQAPVTAREGNDEIAPHRPEPRTYEVKRAGGAISVDGALDEPAWSEATEIEVLFEWYPGDNTEPPVETSAFLTFDRSNLYIGFRARDPEPAKIRAHLMDRDQIDTLVQDDYVIIQIDTFNDQRRSYQFRVNPLGVQADALSSAVDGTEDWSWDMIWTSKGRITADGFEVEVALPFNQLRFPGVRGVQTWGIDVGRSYPRSSRHRMNASGRDRNQACWVCQFHKITGLEGLEPGRNLEINPTVTALRTDELDRFPDGDLVAGDEEAEGGLTLRWGVSPNLTLTGTLNPDFSQVEADVAQLDINERFALFFEEKRPFFLEGVAYFNVPNRIIFTRTVVDPDWGLKVAGKHGKNGIGLFAAEDSVNSLLFPSNQGSQSTLLNEPVTGGVLRYRRDVGASSALGLVYTDREAEGYRNRVAGVDGFFRPRDTDTLMFHYLRSETRYPRSVAEEFGQPLGDFEDDLWEVRYEYDSRNWNLAVDYEDSGPGFRADSGFVPRVDIREAQGLAIRKLWGDEDSWYDELDFGAYVNHTEDHDGRLTDEVFEIFATLIGPLQSVIDLDAQRRAEFFDGILYRDLDSSKLSLQMQPTGALRLSLFAEFAEVIDYANNQPADEVEISPAVEVKIGRHLNASLDHRLQRLEVAEGELFEANLSQLRLVYNFNVRTFVRAIFQYLDVVRDPELYDLEVEPEVEPEVETLLTQLLFSYKLNARTVLFVGYSENQRGLEGVDLTRTDRTLFFKIGYAWLL